MLQAPVLNSLAFDPSTLQLDGLTASEIDIGRREIAQDIVIAVLVVMLNEGLDMVFQIPGQIVALQKNAVLQRLMPAFNLALCHGVVGRAADMLEVAVAEPGCQITGDVAGTIVRQEPWSADYISATSEILRNLSCELQPVHTFGS